MTVQSDQKHPADSPRRPHWLAILIGTGLLLFLVYLLRNILLSCASVTPNRCIDSRGI